MVTRIDQTLVLAKKGRLCHAHRGRKAPSLFAPSLTRSTFFAHGEKRDFQSNRG
jgi:hypothetical protein